MGNIRRRTVTIVITDTWTIVWSSADDSLHPVSRIVHITPEAEEELDETLQSGLIAANPNPSQPPAQPSIPSDMPADAKSSRRKRVYGRHAGNKP